MTAIKEPKQIRWAIIKTIAKGADAEGERELVTSIQLRPEDKGPPDLRGLHRTGSPEIDTYSVEEVPNGVYAGMRRGGTFAPVGDFGWRDANDRDVNAPREAFEVPKGAAGHPRGGFGSRRIGKGPMPPKQRTGDLLVDDGPDPLSAA